MTARSPRARRIDRRAILAAVATALTAIAAAATVAGAQVIVRRPEIVPVEGPITNYLGGALLIAQPQRDFSNYVNGAFGIGGDFRHAIDDQGIVSFRASAGFLVYGMTTNRQALGGGALGLVAVDVSTSNNIFYGTVGLQLTAPSGPVRPYVHGDLGFSSFWTQSSVEGAYSSQPFASSNNYSDGGFTTTFGGGFYVPLGKVNGRTPILLDIGATAHANADIKYLTKNSIYIQDASSPPVITPVRSAADFVAFRIGLSFGLR